MSDDLRDVFASEESAEEETPAAEPEKEPEKAAEEEAPAETEDKVEEDEPTSSEDKPDTDEQSVPLAALQSERGKRRELETEVSQLKSEFQKVSSELAELKKKPAPDKYDDPEGYAEYVEQEATEKGNNALKEAQDKLIRSSDKLMAKHYEDWPDIREAFLKMAESDDMLAYQFRHADSPCLFAYEHVKKQQAFEEIGDPVAFKEKLRQDILKELNNSEPSKDDDEEEVPDLATATESSGDGKGKQSSPVDKVFAD